MSTIFISYSRKDLPYVEKLDRKLRDEGFFTWRDMRSLNAGDMWWKTIENAISDCACMLVVVSENSKSSTYVEREFHIAEKLNKPIVPISLSNTRWSLCDHLQYEDVTLDDLPRALFFDGLARYATRYKVSAASEKWILHLISLFNNAEREINVGAVSALISIGERAVPYLIDALDSDSSADRVSSMDALTGIGPAAVPSLIDALKDKRKSVSTRSAKILGRIRDQRAISPLTAALSFPATCVDAASALGRFGELAIDEVMSVLNQTDERSVIAACWALTDIGSPKAIPFLQNLLIASQSQSICKAADDTLSALNEKTS